MKDKKETSSAIEKSNFNMMTVKQAQSWYNKFVEISKSVLKEGLDYGVIDGVEKPSLFKPGAEKLRVFYGLSIETNCVDKTVDLDRGYIDYTYKTTVKTPSGQIIGECEGSCNSYETKYRYLWVKETDLPDGFDVKGLKVRDDSIKEPMFAIDKAETTGKYGKSAEYWEMFKKALKDGTAVKKTEKNRFGKDMEVVYIPNKSYRVQNPDILNQKNTIQKMSQKRSFVGAILIATGASEFYTQDLEEMDGFTVKQSIENKIKEGDKTSSISSAEDAEIVDDSNIELSTEEYKAISHYLESIGKIEDLDQVKKAKEFFDKLEKGQKLPIKLISYLRNSLEVKKTEISATSKEN